MPRDRFKSLEKLIQRANQTSSSEPGSIHMLARVIQLVADDGADPYTVIGVLVEGAVTTIARHVPPERQAETTAELQQLLASRLEVHRLK